MKAGHRRLVTTFLDAEAVACAKYPNARVGQSAPVLVSLACFCIRGPEADFTWCCCLQANIDFLRAQGQETKVHFEVCPSSLS